ncbi:MAG TPA: MMPL family transporter, partial [Streptosporangiaceae bacterium]
MSQLPPVPAIRRPAIPGPTAPHPVPRSPLGRLGLGCYRHRWLTLIVWIAGLACLITLWTRFGAGYDNSFNGSDPGQAVLNAHFHRQSGDQLTLAIRSGQDIRSPAVRARVAGALAPLRHAAGVTAVTSPYQAPGQISRNGHIAFATVQFGRPGSAIPTSEALALMQDARSASGHGVAFSLGGDVVDLAETPYGGPTEGVGVIAAAIVLLIAFGSLLAMGLPVVTALFGIGCGLALIALLGHVFPAPSFSPIVAGMIGLGVGVDYALFIVTRFREALRGGEEPQKAVVTAMSTAGRSVLTAGATVAIGLLGLLVLRQSLLNGVAVAAAATVAMTVLGSLTLLPALLGFTGTRLAKLPRFTLRSAAGRLGLGRPRRPAGGRPERTARGGVWGGRPPGLTQWAAVVQRRPVIAAVLSAAALLALAAPALGLKLSFPDESAEARGTMGYATYATMAKGFGPGFDAPLLVAAMLPSRSADTARLAAALRDTPGVVGVTPARVSPDGRAVMMIAYPATGEQDP